MVDVFGPLIGVLIGAFISGSIYCLVALSMSMLWYTVGLPNFAQGSLIILGAYVVWWLWVATGFAGAVFVMIPLMAIFALGTNVIFAKARKEPDALLRLTLITITFAVVIEQVLNVIFGGDRKRIPVLVQGAAQVGGYVISYEQFVSFGVAIIVLVLMYLYLTRTITGLAIRALGQSMEESLTVGVNAERVYLITVAIGFIVTGVAGGLFGSLYIFQAVSGRPLLFIGYIIVVLAGLGTIRGVVYASYLVALIESLTVYYVGGELRIAVPFLIMIVVLMIRPTGLFGMKEQVK